jgi:hypothetical protein
MPVTTFYSDDEVRLGREGYGKPVVRELIKEVRSLTGEDWIAVQHFKVEHPPWWRWWEKPRAVEFWTIARYVGGAGPWQLHGDFSADADTCARYLQCIADGAFSRSLAFPLAARKEHSDE